MRVVNPTTGGRENSELTTRCEELTTAARLSRTRRQQEHR